MSDEDGLHQLHINVPKALHEELKLVLTDHGAITALVRNFLQRFIINHNKATIKGTAPFDKALEELTEKHQLTLSSGEEG